MIALGSHPFRNLFAFICLVGTLLFAASASAAGRVKWKSRTLKESDSGSWKLELEIYLNRAPDVAHVPMAFSFQPTVYYERTLVDGQDGPVLRKVPLEHRQPLVESVDVGFLDPGTGVIQTRTRFSFKVTRAHGYEAGEYKVSIKNTRSGQSVGTATTLTFEGENEIIDRRSMVFTGNEKKKKKEDEEDMSESEAEPEKRELTPEDDAYWAGGPTEDGPPPIEEKPGGCGCRLGATTGPSVPWSLGVVGAGVVLAVSRRRQRSVQVAARR